VNQQKRPLTKMSGLKIKKPNDSPRWAPADLLRFSDYEIHFYWHFIQGSIMNPPTRWHLRHAWGMCDRHSFGFVAIEAAYRGIFLHGQAILYEDLMERALAAFKLTKLFYERTVASRLEEKEPCLMCKGGFGLHSKGTWTPEMIERGRNLKPVRAFAKETSLLWSKRVCGRCAGNDLPSLCRIHLREALQNGICNLPEQRAYVQDILKRITHYSRSFVWGHHGTDTLEDRASLIEAIGWLNGWRPWLMLCDRKLSEKRGL
jgi:hypothetical protein